MKSWFDTRSFAASIRTRRDQRGLREVASEIGTVSPSTLSRIERDASPDIETFLHLCDWLHQPASTCIRSDLHDLAANENESTQLIEQALRADGILAPHIIDAFLTLIKAVRSQKLERPHIP